MPFSSCTSATPRYFPIFTQADSRVTKGLTHLYIYVHERDTTWILIDLKRSLKASRPRFRLKPSPSSGFYILSSTKKQPLRAQQESPWSTTRSRSTMFASRCLNNEWICKHKTKRGNKTRILKTRYADLEFKFEISSNKIQNKIKVSSY